MKPGANHAATREPLPALRRGLDAFPSPDPAQPGLVLRDPMGYTQAMVIVPPAWLPALMCLDGAHTMIDCQGQMGRMSGEVVPAHLIQELIGALGTHGFLATEEFERMRAARVEEFRQAPARAPRHAGGGYPATAEDARRQLDQWFGSVEPAAGGLAGTARRAIAAPHVSPHGGVECYVDAYRSFPEDLDGRTVVILGTSHYGIPNRFGLTRKPYQTPLGDLEVDEEAVDLLTAAAGAACIVEDYCHAVEHSIEFQCLFTRYRARRPPRIVPILCGPLWETAMPSPGEAVPRFFDALGEWAARKGDDLFWVLGIDLAHMGRRYGDVMEARAGEGEMVAVERADRQRLAAALAGDPVSFRALVEPEQDRLKWCGYSPLYTFLRVQPEARGSLVRYQQWNIDESSVVSFAALRFD